MRQRTLCEKVSTIIYVTIRSGGEIIIKVWEFRSKKLSIFKFKIEFFTLKIIIFLKKYFEFFKVTLI